MNTFKKTLKKWCFSPSTAFFWCFFGSGFFPPSFCQAGTFQEPCQGRRAATWEKKEKGFLLSLGPVFGGTYGYFWGNFLFFWENIVIFG